jgi:tRNA 2-thiouridine synthesizing protein A
MGKGGLAVGLTGAVTMNASENGATGESAPAYQREVDARGLNCPLPILRTKKALNDMTAGQVLRILATDPSSVRDFEAFARQTGNELLQQTEQGGEFMFLLRRR